MYDVASLIPNFLNGVGRLEQLSLIDAKKYRVGKPYSQIRNLLNLGSRHNQILDSPNRDPARKNIQEDQNAENIALSGTYSAMHPVCRLDLVRDIQGNFFIAEIEVGKLHGLGYTTFCRSVSNRPIGIGLVNYVVKLTEHHPSAIVLSETESFYQPEAAFFSRAVNSAGGNLVTTSSLQSDGFSPLSTSDRRLSSKTIMALIHSRDQELFGLLERTVGIEALKKLRRYIPHTEAMSIATKEQREDIVRKINADPNCFFVKVKDASGARGIIPPGNPDEQVAAILGPGYKQVIVQQAIVAEQVRLGYQSVLDGATGTDFFSTRYALFVSGNGDVLDLGLTSSVGAIAHGGVKSIHMGYKVI